MPDSTGVNRQTGQPLSDWDHTAQSIGVIFETQVGDVVMLRDFGSEIPLLIDRPQTPRVTLGLYAAAKNALVRWAPRYDLTHCFLNGVGEQGRVGLTISGDYYPRGHIGDFSVVERRRGEFIRLDLGRRV